MPQSVPGQLTSLVTEYLCLNEEPLDVGAEALLKRIDATVLAAYDLPPRLERQLLERFRQGERQVPHSWSHWFPENFTPFVPLAEYLSNEYEELVGDRILEVFAPLPRASAETLRGFLR